MKTPLASLFLPVFLLITIVAQAARDKEPQHAPPDAFLPGQTLPYFGSENPWDQRFFFKQNPPRLGQPQLLLLTQGKIKEAIDLCHQRLETDGSEVESHLILAYAFARQGAIDKAEASLIDALNNGLPPERILVGPRSLIKPLQNTKTYQHLVATSTGLLQGPMLGAVTDRSARFWVRTLKESKVEIRIGIPGAFHRAVSSGSSRSEAVKDFTAVVAVEDLDPNTEYVYKMLVDGRMIPSQPEWRFTTFPNNETEETVRVAFGGCAQYYPPYERMWDAIQVRRPDAFLILGDNVYIDLPQTVGPFHDYTYYQRQSRPEFRRLVAGTPIYAIWDDHDAGIDDVFLGVYTDKPAWKPQFFDLFRRNWNNPFYGQEPERPGVWFNFRVGSAEFFMLDGRYYRENFLEPNPSMLGPEQKQWLFNALGKSTATFKLIVSPVAFSDDAKIDDDVLPSDGEYPFLAKDVWSGFPGERQEIYDYLADNRISGVVLLSADRHRADLRINHRRRGYPLYELMCSWLTNPNPSHSSGTPLWEYFEKPSYALLSFDPGGPDPTLTMEVANIDGDTVLLRDLHLSELSDK